MGVLGSYFICHKNSFLKQMTLEYVFKKHSYDVQNKALGAVREVG